MSDNGLESGSLGKIPGIRDDRSVAIAGDIAARIFANSSQTSEHSNNHRVNLFRESTDKKAFLKGKYSTLANVELLGEDQGSFFLGEELFDPEGLFFEFTESEEIMGEVINEALGGNNYIEINDLISALYEKLNRKLGEGIMGNLGK